MAALSLGVGSSAWATQVTWWDTELKSHTGKLSRLDAEHLVLLDENGLPDRVPLSRVVRVVRDESGQASEAQSQPGVVVTLTDGQRFVGVELMGETPGSQGQSLRFGHPRLGMWDEPLERLGSVTRGTGSEATDGLAEDRLELDNGQVLSGFVEAVDSPHVLFTAAGTETAVPVPWARVSGLHLSNPKGAMLDTAHYLALRDGSRLAVLSATGDRDGWSIRLASSPDPSEAVLLSPADWVELRPGGQGFKLVSLLDLPWDVVRGGEVFGVPRPPRRDGGALRLDAPVTVRWALPGGASRFRVQAAQDLDASIEPAKRAWASSSIQVQTGERTSSLDRAALNVESPQATLVGTVAGPSLSLELQASEHGPVLDRVRLREAWVLVIRQP